MNPDVSKLFKGAEGKSFVRPFFIHTFCTYIQAALIFQTTRQVSHKSSLVAVLILFSDESTCGNFRQMHVKVWCYIKSMYSAMLSMQIVLPCDSNMLLGTLVQ